MKIPAEFAPQSWEMPPGFRVVEENASVVTRNFSGRSLKWVVALVEIPKIVAPILWVRPLDSSFDAGFIALQTSFPDLSPMAGNIDSSILGTVLTTLWQGNRLARYFLFNENGDLWNKGDVAKNSILVAPTGMAAWTGKAIRDIYKPIVFDWGAPMENSEFLHLPSLELWKQIQNDTSGESLRARNFASMDNEERHQLIWGNSCISQQAMEALLRTLIVEQSFWENSEIPEVSVDVYTEEGEIELCVNQGINYKTLAVTEELVENIKLLSSFFHLPSDSTISDEGSSYQRIWASGRTVNFEFIVSRPTSHEQLEAALRWRDWLDSIDHTENQKF